MSASNPGRFLLNPKPVTLCAVCYIKESAIDADTKGVPIKDPEKRRLYQRDYQRRRRFGDAATPAAAPLPAAYRIESVADLMAILETQLFAVMQDRRAGSIEKARCVGFLINIGFKALEQRDLFARVEALESVLKFEARHDGPRR